MYHPVHVWCRAWDAVTMHTVLERLVGRPGDAAKAAAAAAAGVKAPCLTNQLEYCAAVLVLSGSRQVRDVMMNCSSSAAAPVADIPKDGYLGGCWDQHYRREAVDAWLDKIGELEGTGWRWSIKPHLVPKGFNAVGVHARKNASHGW